VVLLAFAPCEADNSSLAFQWAWPLWKQANLRYLQSTSITFAMNHIAIRRSNALNTNTVTLCTASLCTCTTSLLNPSPVVSPNTDTVYGAAWTDLQVCFTLTIPSAQTNTTTGTLRSYSVIFLDMYTNTELIFSAGNYPAGGKFCVCKKGATPNCVGTTASFPSLSQYGFMALRVWSNGVSDTCGVDGCKFIQSIAFTPVSTISSPLAVNSLYGPDMSTASECAYSCNPTVPCGTGSPTYFWKAVCLALSESPLTGAEATYVANSFLSLGINSAGCTSSPNYTALNVALTNASTSGWTQLVAAVKTSSYTQGPWVFLRYTDNNLSNGTATWYPDLLTRAITATRLLEMNVNEKAVYYTAFNDSNQIPLSGANNQTYQISAGGTFPLAPEGFWSFTVYGPDYFFANDSTTSTRLAYKGTQAISALQFNLSSSCTSANCVTIPKGAFNVMLRGYSPLPSFIITGTSMITLPSITRCTTACN